MLRYYPGDIVEVDERHFSPDFMEKVIETPVVATVVKVEEEAKVEEKESEKPAEVTVRRKTRQLPEEP